MSRDRDWPLFGLWIETPRLTLRYPTDDDLAALNNLAGQGIHDPALMPFDVPWTDDPPGSGPSIRFSSIGDCERPGSRRTGTSA